MSTYAKYKVHIRTLKVEKATFGSFHKKNVLNFTLRFSQEIKIIHGFWIKNEKDITAIQINENYHPNIDTFSWNLMTHLPNIVILV